jgi:serine/threonine protein kinase
MASDEESAGKSTIRETTPPLTRTASDGDSYLSRLPAVTRESLKTPRARRKSDIHDLLPELLSRHESEASCFNLIEPGKTISDLFEVDEQMYSFGAKSVSRCVERSSSRRFVMKRRMKEAYIGEVERHWRRVMEKLMRAGPNKHIAQIHDIFEDDSAFYIIMEECNGGQLFDLLLRESTMSTKELKRIIREILLAVEHLHDLGLIHRDIKPENIMLTEGTDEYVLKLIDFDTCEEIVSRRLSLAVTPSDKVYRKRSTRVVGTLGYIAPESFSGEYSTASDMFSIGVIFYILMTGDMPFDDSIFQQTAQDNDGDLEIVGSPRCKRVANSLVSYSIDWNISPWPQMPVARDLCQKLLELDPESRIGTCREALSHQWLTSFPATPSRGPN